MDEITAVLTPGVRNPDAVCKDYRQGNCYLYYP